MNCGGWFQLNVCAGSENFTYVSGIYGGSVFSTEEFSSLETAMYISLRRRMLFVTYDGAVLISIS